MLFGKIIWQTKNRLAILESITGWGCYGDYSATWYALICTYLGQITCWLNVWIPEKKNLFHYIKFPACWGQRKRRGVKELALLATILGLILGTTYGSPSTVKNKPWALTDEYASPTGGEKIPVHNNWSNLEITMCQVVLGDKDNWEAISTISLFLGRGRGRGCTASSAQGWFLVLF